MLVEVGPVGAFGETVEVGEQVDLLVLIARPDAGLRFADEVVDQHLGVHLLLDVERRRVDDEVAPVLYVLAAPDELRIEVAVAALVRQPHRRLIGLLHDRLVLGSRDVRTGVLDVLERLDRLGHRSLSSHPYAS